MKFGYARISTSDQDASLQRDALKAAGCDKIVVDQVSGAATKRSKLDRLIKSMGAGDVLSVWRLDRVGRSLPHLLTFVRELQDRGIGFQSLHETFDTTSANGKLMFHVFAALIEFERDLLVERTNAGLNAARKRGARIGRPPALNSAQIRHAQKLIDAGERPTAIAATLGVDRSTLYRALK